MSPADSVARLSGVSGTLLATLAVRGYQHDARAECLCRDLGLQLGPPTLPRANIQGSAARSGWFDRRCLRALRRLRNPLFVSLGSGLDTRYDRIRHRALRQTFEWIDSDLPEVVALRRALLPDGSHHRTITLDITRADWAAAIDAPAARPIVFVAEAVLMYLHTAALMVLFRTLADRFARHVAVEILFDWVSPEMQRISQWYAATGPAGCRAVAFHSSLLRASDIRRVDPRWRIVAQFDAMRRAGFAPAVRSTFHLLRTTRRFMGCAHAVLAPGGIRTDRANRLNPRALVAGTNGPSPPIPATASWDQSPAAPAGALASAFPNAPRNHPARAVACGTPASTRPVSEISACNPFG